MNTFIRNVVWHPTKITKNERRELNQHKSCVLWFTGLSASGKSTLANEIELELFKYYIRSYTLDGDNIRSGLNKDLGFCPEDRKENIRRIGEVAKLFVDSGVITLTAFISPYREEREMVRHLFEQGEFVEIYVKCPLEVCEQRDPKGLYWKARLGKITDFTGISAPYEEPLSPEIIIETDKQSLIDSVKQIIDYLKNNGYIRSA